MYLPIHQNARYPHTLRNNIHGKPLKYQQIKQNIASNIRQYRAKKKISQEKLSELTGISQQHISNIENEQVNPSIELLLKIADALDVTLNDLVY